MKTPANSWASRAQDTTPASPPVLPSVISATVCAWLMDLRRYSTLLVLSHLAAAHFCLYLCRCDQVLGVGLIISVHVHHYFAFVTYATPQISIDPILRLCIVSTYTQIVLPFLCPLSCTFNPLISCHSSCLWWFSMCITDESRWGQEAKVLPSRLWHDLQGDF